MYLVSPVLFSDASAKHGTHDLTFFVGKREELSALNPKIKSMYLVGPVLFSDASAKHGTHDLTFFVGKREELSALNPKPNLTMSHPAPRSLLCRSSSFMHASQ